MEKEEKTTPMLSQWFETKEKYPDYLLFFRLGDFYELFFDDAITASKALDITLTKRGKHKGEDVPLCGVPFHAYESYLSKLVKQGYKVAICEQMESPEQAKKERRTVRRDVVRIVTAGTLTEENLLEAKKNNFILSVFPSKGQFGVAWSDLSTGDFFMQAIAFGGLSTLLTKLEPAEIIFPYEYQDKPEFKNILSSFDEKITTIPLARFSYMNAKEKMQDTFSVLSLDAFGSFSELEITAAGVLLDYIELTQQNTPKNLKVPEKVDASDLLEIDASTRRSLELFYSLSGERHAQSLHKIMDKTVSAGGGRLFSSWLMSPLTSVQRINERLDGVSFFVEDFDIRAKLRDLLKLMPDIDRSLSRLSLGRGGPRDLKAVRDGLDLIPKIQNIFNGVIYPAGIDNCLKNMDTHDMLVDTLRQAVKNDDLPLFVRDGGFIASGYDVMLDDLRAVKDNADDIRKQLQDKYIELTGVTTLKVQNNSLMGLFIEVPAKQAQRLFDNIEWGFIHRQTMTNNVRFMTVELNELQEKVRTASEKIQAIEERIFAELVTDIISQANDIYKTTASVSILDVESSLAQLAVDNNYCRPVVDNSFAFDIKAGRHPVVEESLKKNRQDFIANDCCLQNPQGRFWLLTGPNMAGKSTFLRQNALIVIMAQTGSFVPASSAHIGVVDKVFSRVGASDDLAKGQSTFMVEMVETATILNQATQQSLVILDEIGRGTATFDGLSIAWAVAEHLHDKNKSRAVFATHYHEMSALDESLSDLSLHAMKIKEWNDEIVFLHSVGEGAVDKSYGIHVGKLAGLPKSVLRRAEQILISLESKQDKHHTLADDFPLFASSTKNQAEQSPVEKELTFINPDQLTPKQALDELYRLKEMINSNE